MAKLAGLPEEVISNARQILEKLEATRSLSPKFNINHPPNISHLNSDGQLTLLPSISVQSNVFSKKEKKVIEKIKNLNLVDITPLEALNMLFSLQSRLLSKKKKENFIEKDS